MEELLKLIKAIMKDGADITAIEKLVKGLNPLDGIKTKEDAIVLIEKTPLLKSGFDSMQGKAAAAHDEKFMEDTLPGLLKAEGEKIRKEINPEESKEQKTIREQGEQIAALTATGKKADLKTALLNQAKELEYSGNVDLFISHGEKAGDFLKSEAKRFKTAVDERVSSNIKKLYGDTKPKTSEVDPAKSMTRSDYEAMTPTDQANVNFSDITLVD